MRRKLVVTYAIVGALLVSANALAGSRAAEALLKSFEDVAAPADVQSALVSDVKRYLSERETKVAAIADTLDPNNDREILDRWRSTAQSTADWAEDYFERLEDTYEDHHAAADAVGAARIREHNHFTLIAKSELPEKRDLLWERMGELVSKQEELDKKWNELKRKDNAVDQDFQRTVKELNEAFKKVMEDEVRYRGKVTENMRTFASRYSDLTKEALKKGAELAAAVFFKDPAAGELTGAALETWIDYNEAMSGMWSNLDSRMKIALRLVQTERNILITFEGTRDGVESFLKTYDASKIRRIEDDAASIASNIEREEEDLADESMEQVKKMYAAYNTIFEKFVDKHEYIFFGPVGQQGLEELLEVRASEAAIGEIRAHKVADLLGRKYLTGSTAFDVSLSSLSPEHREYLIEEILEPEVEKTVSLIVKFAKAYDTTVEDILERRLDVLRDTID